jgi:beta-lactamase regulating signal transducer with metallopeptidase domain
MNELGTTLAWSALQVSLAGLAAVVLYVLAARRGPRAGAQVATASLAATVLLTLLAFCPLPHGWNWLGKGGVQPALSVKASPPRGEAPARPGDRLETEETAASPAPGEGGLTWPTAFLRSLWERMNDATVAAVDTHSRWASVVAIVFLIGCGLCSLRLLLGLWAVQACRRGVRISDPCLLRTVEALRSDMGCSRTVEVWETPDLVSPATAGWRRPLVLLPHDWRNWSDAERRAVLSHELAHVCRGDYLAWLVARLSVALHFYHPLVYWMAGRLQLQQELAADALGAQFAGGRGVYLRALAQLALRQEDQTPSWLGRTFVSKRGTLMRRIHMLRSKDCSPRPLPRVLRAGLLVVATIGALGLSALRSPAQKPAEAQVPVEGADPLYLVAFVDSGTVKTAPFDISYLPPDTMGIWGFRPAAVYGRPELKEQAALMNHLLEQDVNQFGLKAGLGLKVEEIEQIVGAVIVQTDPKRKENQSSAMGSLQMIRTVHDFDWKARLKRCFPDAVEVPHAGQVFYRTAKGGVPILHDGFCYYVPDARTLVIDSETNLRRLIEKKHSPLPLPWAEGWKAVEGNVLAVALDNHDGRWKRELAKRTQPDPSVDPFVNLCTDNATALAFGIGGDDKAVVEVRVLCTTEKGGQKVVRMAENVLTLAQTTLEQETRNKPPKGPAVTAVQWMKGLLQNAHVDRQGTVVRVHSEVKESFSKVMAAVLSGELGQ